MNARFLWPWLYGLVQVAEAIANFAAMLQKKKAYGKAVVFLRLLLSQDQVNMVAVMEQIFSPCFRHIPAEGAVPNNFQLHNRSSGSSISGRRVCFDECASIGVSVESREQLQSSRNGFVPICSMGGVRVSVTLVNETHQRL